jgi:hypothetical protein
MDYTELLKNNHPLVAAAFVAVPTILLFNMLFCCCCNRADDKTYEDKEVEAIDVDERNSKLAFMLMLLLTEKKKEHRKYIRMADNIGYDHIIPSADLDQSDSDSESDTGDHKTE